MRRNSIQIIFVLKKTRVSGEQNSQQPTTMVRSSIVQTGVYLPINVLTFPGMSTYQNDGHRCIADIFIAYFSTHGSNGEVRTYVTDIDRFGYHDVKLPGEQGFKSVAVCSDLLCGDNSQKLYVVEVILITPFLFQLNIPLLLYRQAGWRTFSNLVAGL